MKINVTGIVAEYNPFHNGHAYQIRETRKRTGCEYCVAVISGDFVQRGEVSVFSKYLRTKMALLSGADLVLEIPSIFAVSSAEDFAAGSVALLDNLGVVTHLCFGSETGESENFMDAAKILADEPAAFSEKLKENLQNGLTWPQARVQALNKFMPDGEIPPLLDTPNNLLGVEYCKALIKRNSSILPVAIRRKGNGYHSEDLEGELASASAIRKGIFSEYPATGQSGDDLNRNAFLFQVPKEIRSLFKEELPLQANDLSELLNYRLLTLNRDHVPFSSFADVSKDISDRLEHVLYEQGNFEERIFQLKTRQYTYTRISRCLLHILLGITDEMVLAGKEAGYAPYARILGFRKDKAALLGDIKKHARIPLVTKTADASRMLSDTANMLFQQDLYASHVRQSLLAAKTGQPVRNEYTQPICIL